jgi:hypothetical protein
MRVFRAVIALQAQVCEAGRWTAAQRSARRPRSGPP